MVDRFIAPEAEELQSFSESDSDDDPTFHSISVSDSDSSCEGAETLARST